MLDLNVISFFNIFICKIVKLQDIENGSAKGSTPNVLDYKDGGIYDEIEKDSATPTKNGKPNGTAHSTEDVYAVPDKRKSNPPESPKLGTPKYIMVSNCIYYYIQVQSLTPSNCRLLIAEIFKQHSNLICLYIYDYCVFLSPKYLVIGFTLEKTI